MTTSSTARPFHDGIGGERANWVRAIVHGLLASAVFVGVGLLVEGWQPGTKDVTRFTTGLYAMLVLPAALATALLLPLARLPIVTHLASIVSLALPYLLALAYELSQPGGNHNLFPIEMALILGGIELLHVPAALLLLVLVIRAMRRSPPLTWLEANCPTQSDGASKELSAVVSRSMQTRRRRPLKPAPQTKNNPKDRNAPQRKPSSMNVRPISDSRTTLECWRTEAKPTRVPRANTWRVSHCSTRRTKA